MVLSTPYNRTISTLNKYEQQGQRLYSQNWSEEYKENYEKIFGKKESWLDRKERESIIMGLVKLVQHMDRQNIPREGRTIKITKGQAKLLEQYLTDPTTLPDAVLGCKLEVVEEMQEKKKHDDCTD